MAAVAKGGGGGEQLGQALVGRGEEGLGLGGVGRAAGGGPGERAVEQAHPAKLQWLMRPGVILTMVPDSRARPMRRYCGYFSRRRLGAALELGPAGEDLGPALDDHPAQAAPVLVVLVDDHAHPGVVLDVADPAEAAAAARLGLASMAEIERGAVPGIAEGHHEGLARRHPRCRGGPRGRRR